jgi:LemA family protein
VKQKIEKLEEVMSLLILVLSLLLIIQILEIIVVQNKKYTALKVSENDFIVSVNDKDKMTNFIGK